MKGFVYLLRKDDLYRIGATKDIEKQIKKIKPDEVVEMLQTDSAKSLEARLLRRYKSKRIPDTSYFRLSSSQVQDCKKQLTRKGHLPSLTLSSEVSIGFNAALLFFFASFASLFFFNKDLILSLSAAIAFCSLPMWILSIVGNLGGYDVSDLPLFSSWSNRFKGLSIAIIMDSISALIFYFHKITLGLI